MEHAWYPTTQPKERPSKLRLLLWLGAAGVVVTILVLWLRRPGPTPAGSTPRLPAPQSTTLECGLKVVTITVPDNPIAGVTLAFPVGSADDPVGQKGMAHLFEHMLFRETSSFSANYERICAVTNAFTTVDSTVYITEAPGAQLELLLWTLAKQLSAPQLHATALNTEREVVIEEYLLYQQHANVQGFSQLSERLWASSDPNDRHPYSSHPLGSPTDLRNLTTADLWSFWQDHYGLAGAALVVTGDFGHQEVVALAQRYLSWLPKRTKPIRTYPSLESPDNELVAFSAPSDVAYAHMSYRLGAVDIDDLLALEFFARTVDQVLYSAVVNNEWAVTCYTRLDTLAEDTVFTITLEDLGTHEGYFLFRQLDEQIASFLDEPWEHFRAYQAEMSYEARQAFDSPFERSMAVAHWALGIGPNPFSPELEERRLAMSWDDVRTRVKRLLTPERRLRAVVTPDRERATVPAAIRGSADAPSLALPWPDSLPTAPPIVEQPPQLDTPTAVQRRTPHGLLVTVLPDRSASTTMLYWGTARGTGDEPADKPGLAWLSVATAVQAVLVNDEDFWARSNFQVESTTSFIYLGALPHETAAAVQALHRLVTTVDFPADTCDHIAWTIETEVARLRQAPASIAVDAFVAGMFGDTRFTTAGGLYSSVSALPYGSMVVWWEENIRPENSHLIITGPVDAKKTAEEAVAIFGNWHRSRPMPPREPIPRPTPNAGLRVVNRDLGQQCGIHAGYVTDWSVAGQRVTGHGVDSLYEDLWQRLRSELGLTYDLEVDTIDRRGIPVLEIRLNTHQDNVPTAIRHIRTVLDERRARFLADDPPAPDPAYFAAWDARMKGSPRWRAWVADKAHRHGPELFNPLTLCAVPAAALREAAPRVMRPEDLYIVVVGPGELLLKSLADLGPVELLHH